MSTFVSFVDFALVLYYHPLLATLLAAFVKKKPNICVAQRLHSTILFLSRLNSTS